MLVFSDIKSIREHLHPHRGGAQTIGLVPTMGALHEGHLSLVKRCKSQNDIVVCSIFVNPAQFNNQEDLDKYPRNLSRDLELLKSYGCDVVFMPTVSEMYPDPSVVRMEFGPLEERLEGAFRPGHFAGVGLVVSKLMNIIQPNTAYFGQKDLQQYVIVSQLVNDLSFPVSLHCEPIVRESNGLAMSSRNERLTDEQRQVASALFLSLKEGRKAVLGDREPFNQIAGSMIQWLSEQGVEPEYYEIVDAGTMEKVSNKSHSARLAICVAGYVGGVRLIDNIIVERA
jgi:pantoate--beta-alanine ligase